MKNEKDNRITVLQLIGSLHIGGAERQLVSLVPHFNTEKFRIIVAALQPGGVLEHTLRESGVDVRNINFRTRHLCSGVVRIARLLNDEKVDILHSHLFHASRYSRLGGLCAHTPVMITTDHGQELWKKPWDVAFEKWANKYTALRIAVSQDVADIIKIRENVPDEKLLVVPNGVDVECFKVGETERSSIRSELGFTEESIVIGTLARLAPPKALHFMIEAFAQLTKAMPQMRLMLVGYGPLQESLERRAYELGVRDLVLFTGARSDIPAMLAAMDIFALSSISEGLPISLLEAMAAGKPIVATRVGGIPEAVADREQGLLVDPGDPYALADAIREVAENRELASKLGCGAADKVAAQYSVAVTARRLEDVYISLLEKQRHEKTVLGR